jgi:hypothetical protein
LAIDSAACFAISKGLAAGLSRGLLLALFMLRVYDWQNGVSE